MERSRRCAGTSYLVIFALLAVSCGEQWEHCGGDSDRDFIHGDRCPALLRDGEIRLTPSRLRLQPATAEMPSSGRLSILGFKEETPADGYFVDIEVLGHRSTDGTTQAECNLGLSLAPAQGAEPCAINTPLYLRCLLDANGLTILDVSSTLDHTSIEECTIRVLGSPKEEPSTCDGTDCDEDSKKKKEEVTCDGMDCSEATVYVDYASDPDLVIHLTHAQESCGSAEVPCEVRGGDLPADLCDSGPAASPDAREVRASFYLATERNGVQVPIHESLSLTLEAVENGATNGLAVFSDEADCSDPDPDPDPDPESIDDGDISLDKIGQTSTYYLCADGSPGEYELRARDEEAAGSGLTASLFVSFPPIPAKISLRADDEGDTDGTTGEPGGPSYYTLIVTDHDGRELDELLEVSVGGTSFQIPSGISFSADPIDMTLDVSFVNWNGSCNLPL